MTEQLNTLLTSYERGALTRRELLHALAVLAIPAAAPVPQSASAVLNGFKLHHVNVQVSDVARSEAFYRKFFGLPPTRTIQGQDAHGFDLPGGELISIQKGNQPGRIDHFCIGVANFNSSRMAAAVKAAGAEDVREDGVGNSFFLRDPDGVRVQVSAKDWKG